MSYETMVCVVVRCDTCHAAAPDGTKPIGRWPAGSVSAEQLPGWDVTGSRHYCPCCRVRRECAAAGHDWGPWTTLADVVDELAERVCLGCGLDQLAPAYTLAPVRSNRGRVAGVRRAS